MGDQEPNLLPTPWRDLGKDPWTEETKNKLREEIATHELTKEAGIDHLNVLLVGEIGAGKSSFFNSIESIFDGHVTSRANSGAVEKSLTTQYRQYFVGNGEAKDGKKEKIKFRFCDSMGLEGGENGLSAPDMGKIMDGHVENLAELSGGRFMPGSPGYKTKPTDNDRVHCIAIILNSETVTGMDEDVVQKIKDIRKEADGRHLFPLIILTMIDTLCNDTDKKTSNVFSSKIIQDKVNEVSVMFGIKANQIQPARNYNSQTECVLEMDILTLRALRQILRYSQTYLRDMLEREEEANKLLDQKVAEREKKNKNNDLMRPDPVATANTGRKELESINSENMYEEKKTKENDEAIVKAQKEQAGNVTAAILVDPKNWKAAKHHDCQGAPGQISLQEGEEVKETRADERGWTRVKTQSGQEGAVPTSILVDPTKTSAKKWKATKDFDSQGAPGQLNLQQGEEVEEVGAATKGWIKIRNNKGDEGVVQTKILVEPTKTSAKKWKATNDFDSQGAPGQLNLQQGEEVEEVGASTKGWIKVRNDKGDEGVVPTKFLVDPTKTSTKKWKATNDFDSQGAPGQLNLKQGEEVEEVGAATKGWIKVRNNQGDEGVVQTKFLVDPTKTSAKKWKATNDFDSQGAPGQINLQHGEEVEEVGAATKGWIKVRNAKGDEGVVQTKFLVDPTKISAKKWKATNNFDSQGAPGQLNLLQGEEVEEVGVASKGWIKVRNDKGDEGVVQTKFLVDPTKISAKKWKATNDFDSQGAPGQLNLQQGEEVEEVGAATKGWITVRNNKGDEGVVQTKFLVDPEQITAKKWIASAYSANGAPGLISLTDGEVVEEVKPESGGWILVRNNNGEEGSVPAKFLMSEAVSLGEQQSAQKKIRIAIHSYQPDDGVQGLVNLVAGEELEELETDKGGWTKLRKATGEEGIAPTNFLKEQFEQKC